MRIQRALARAGVASRRKSEDLVSAGRVTVNGAPAQLGQVGGSESRQDRGGRHRREAAAHRAVARAQQAARRAHHALRSRGPRDGVRSAAEDSRAHVRRPARLPHRRACSSSPRMASAPTRSRIRAARSSARTSPPCAATPLPRCAARGSACSSTMAWSSRRTSTRRRSGADTGSSRSRSPKDSNHEVRRFCQALDLFVQRLVRVRYGPVKLGQLPSGETRPLSNREHEIITALTESAR